MLKNQYSVLINSCKVVALVAGIFLAHSCAVCDCMMPTNTISDILSSDAYKQSATVTADVALDSTNKYFNLYPELQALTTGTTPFTLFAPSNTAFINLTAIPGLANLKTVNPDIFKGVLLYHFVAGKKFQADLTAGSSFPTLYTETKFVTPVSPTLPSVQNITVNSDGSFKTGSSNPSIVITKPNVEATNGIVHIVGTVLIPPSIGMGQSQCLCGTMAVIVLLGKDFTQLAKIIGAADATFIETATSKKITTYLAMSAATFPGGKGGTFFASPNAVLSDATVTAITSTADKGRSFLLNHLVAGKYGVSAGTDVTVMGTTGQTITPFSGKTIVVVKMDAGATAPSGVGVTTGGLSNPPTPDQEAKFAPIFNKDISANNGLIQIIGGVLQ